MNTFKILIFASLMLLAKSLVLFFEDFTDKRFKLRWINSIQNIDKQGNFGLGYGPLTYSAEGQGLKTEDDYRYYLLSRKMKRKYSNKNKTLIIQYQVIFPSIMECGGAYIKVLGSDFEPTTFNSKTPYKIMFGPDVCGFAFEDRDLKVILNYKGKYFKINQLIRYHMSHIPQLFTLIIRPDNTYEIHINMSIITKGKIGKDFRMVRPKMIRDKRVKPSPDWDSREFIVSHNYNYPDHLPHNLLIVDPEYYINSSNFDVSKDLPYIKNPHYMRPWHPPVVRNPKYNGKWTPPLINNPNYNINDNFYLQPDLGGVAIDVWQMSSGVIYDNILITDNEKFAKKCAKEKWENIVEALINTEKNIKPYNETMDQDMGSLGQNQNKNHHDHIDDSGQKACYNNVEAIKNTVFGLTKTQISIMVEQRRNQLIKMKQEMLRQLSPLPQFSFFDPLYFNEPKQEKDGFILTERLEVIQRRRITDTVKFVTENGLDSLK